MFLCITNTAITAMNGTTDPALKMQQLPATNIQFLVANVTVDLVCCCGRHNGNVSSMQIEETERT